MWCIDLQRQQVSRKDGVVVHIKWTAGGELEQTLENAETYSALRKQALLTETRLLINNSVFKRIMRVAI